MSYYPDFEAIRAALADGSATVESVVSGYLSRIAQAQHLNAFVEVWADEALDQARAIDAKRADGKAGPLAGLVLGVKDNICYAGHVVTGSSKILTGFRSLFTAPALQRLIDADAVIIGRTGCDEFAMGSSNENSHYGPVRNPIDPERVPGGSSGGSAAAVCAQLCTVALGSDTGGSVRQPASFCGISAIKPTYGRVSRNGLLAYGSSFDQIAPIAANFHDAALVLRFMAGEDAGDSTSSSQPVPDYSAQVTDNQAKKYKIAIFDEVMGSPGLDPEVAEHLQAVTDGLRAQGHTVDVVPFPLLPYLVPTYYILTTAEASSNLSRYDGVRFGYRTEGAKSLDELYGRSRSEGFGAEVQRRIMLGTFVLSSGYYDAYYTKAQKVRRLIQDQTNALLAQYDFLLSPTAPTTAFKIGEKSDDPIAMYLSDIFTVHANLTGHPAISAPTGVSRAGLPMGTHVLGRFFEEGQLMAFGQALQTTFNPIPQHTLPK